MRILTAALLFGLPLWAQSAPPPSATPPAPDKPSVSAEPTEQQELSQAINDAGSSQVDFIRALEKHLAKYPNSSRRNEIERAIVLAAIKTRDDKRVIEYGERVLAHEPDDLQVLDKVVRALLVTNDAGTSARALKYAHHYDDLLMTTRGQTPPGHMGEAQWHDEVDKGISRVRACEARANGNLGKIDDAIQLARNA